MKLNRFKVLFTLFVFTLMNVSCTLVNTVVQPYTDVTFNVAPDINPDINKRPSPVVVKIFELSSRTVFDTQDFFTLYESPETVLGPDLLKKDELELQPASKLEHNMSLNENTRYIGLVVAYRSIDKARWRAVLPVDPTGYDDFSVNVESIAVYPQQK
ncbi:type VI secretion system lipoprotein TssJ [Algicola sagamiensis]|uniref:type VI secretion system lipoprotein TssJ n=1 Tax=Algicola sagamiensis TaxID=163869 RepID=UPI00035C5B1C|nr:type VI secretion system lipoprotein TssJ [Algicola sagamiensis]